MPDANPPTVSASLDKPRYAKGDRVTLTVVYGDADSATNPLTVTATDASGGTGTAVIQLVVADPVTLTVADPKRAWTLVSDTGSIAVFSSTA